MCENPTPSPEPEEIDDDAVQVLGVVRDEGSVVVFHGRDCDGVYVEFAIDRRIARELADVLPIDAHVEPWQITRRSVVEGEADD